MLAAWYFRYSFWILDYVIVPLKYLLVVVATCVLIGATRRARRPVLAAVVVPLMLVVAVMVVGWWQFAPRAWFVVHRPLFELARTTQPGGGYYGARLPVPLRFLSETSRVSTVDLTPADDSAPPPSVKDGLFFPQWVGIPDDAGGYIYSAAAPVGADLYGDICKDPVDLGDGWWMCNLS